MFKMFFFFFFVPIPTVSPSVWGKVQVEIGFHLTLHDKRTYLMRINVR